MSCIHTCIYIYVSTWNKNVCTSSITKYYFHSSQSVKYCWIIAECITLIQESFALWNFLQNHDLHTNMVYTRQYTYIICTYTVCICMYSVHNHDTFLIRPYQPCDAGESQLYAQSVPFEQHPSCHKSPQLTDHPGAACHVQSATATGLPHTHCSLTIHPLRQCHSCQLGSQNSCAAWI